MQNFSSQADAFKWLLITASFCAHTALGVEASASAPAKTGKPATISGVRSIYLNGSDFSSSRNQDLRNVHVRIDGDGNIFIKAPHYQVVEEDTFVPLSSAKHSQNSPDHVPLSEMKSDVRSEPRSAAKSADPAAVSEGDMRDSALASPVPAGSIQSKGTSSGVEKPAVPQAPKP